MKRLLYFIFFFNIAGIGCLKAQFGLQFGSLIPIGGNQGYILKPGYGGEFLGSTGSIDSRFRGTVNVGYYQFSPTQSSFNGSYSVQANTSVGGYNIYSLTPTNDVISNYNMFLGGMGCVFKIVDKDLSPIVGIEGTIGAIDFTESAAGGDQGPYVQYSLCPKLGASYQIKDNFLLSAGAGYAMTVGDLGGQDYWKPFIQLIYFNN